MLRTWSLRLGGLAAACVSVAALAGGGSAATDVRSEDRPELSAITATFFESLRTTWYDVKLTNPAGPTTWRWDFTPDPLDSTCNQFTASVGGPTSGHAEFAHGAENGCHHTTPDHNVDIEVVVTTGPYTCNARIHGTTTSQGPTPELCFKQPSVVPPPKASTPPQIAKSNKAKWKASALAEFSFGIAAGTNALAWGLIPVPDPVTKGIAVASLGAAVVNLSFGLYFTYKANDPPDPNYKEAVAAVVPRPALLRAGRGVSAAEAAAVNALLTNAAGISANDRAFLTSFERAQGAFGAADGTWDHSQSQAAAGFARAEAALLDKQPALEAALRRALRAAEAKTHARPAVAQVKKARSKGLTSAAVALFRTFGFADEDIASVNARIAHAAPSAAAGPASAKVGGSASANAARSAASLLREMAAELDAR